MDFSYLLEIAKQNSDEAGKKATVKRYSTDLKPPKREAKGNVKSGAVKAFLARKEEEEKHKEVEAQQKKSELLSLRAQNTKNSKKAKLMVSRTKDNDYSKIKLTDEEEQMRKQRESELQRRMLTDKIERMKARIELEEKEKLLPRKRKRKSHVKSDVTNEKSIPIKEDEGDFLNDAELIPNQTVIEQKRKSPLSAPPPMNFHDLLKLASKKQHEPIAAPKIEKKDDRPMTQKERRLYEEQQLRKKGISVYSLPQPTSKKKAKVKSENNVNRKQSNCDSFIGQADQKQRIQTTNNANLSEKTISSNNQRTDFHKENSQHFVNKAMTGHASKLKNDLPIKHSRYIDEEEEYDDDLADFIDDGPVEEEEADFSSQIRQIFKYDRNRYIDDDYDDDDITESSFAEQMKEECRSAKIGRQEDLEDMRKEEEEWKRKLKLMKLKKKNGR